MDNMAFNLGIFLRGIVMFSAMSVNWGSRSPEIEMLPESESDYFVKGVNDSITFTCKFGKNDDSQSMLSLKRCTNQSSGLHDYELLVSGNSVQYDLVHLSKLDSGSYICEYNGRAFQRRHLIVTGPPMMPDSMFCISYEFENIFCNWEIVQSEIPSNWSVSYFRPYLDYGYTSCPGFDETKTSLSCSWTDEDVTSFVMYNISVFGENLLGSILSTFSFHPMEIVKPSPVRVLDASSTNKTISLTWTISDKLYIKIVDFMMVYNVTYWDEYDEHFGEQELIHLDQVTNITLRDIRPYRWYSIRVISKTRVASDTYWSEPSQIKIHSKEAVPSSPPRTSEGLYFIMKDKLLIYLQDFDQRSVNSKRVQYDINVFSNVNRSVTRQRTATIDLPLRGITISNKTTLQIYSRNDVGRSSKFTSFNFTDPKIFSGYVWTEYDEKKGMTELLFEADPSVLPLISKVQFFWCIKELKMERPICQNNVTWTESINERSISLTVSRQHYNWLFGVAMIYQNGRSDGLYFSECNYGYPLDVISSLRIYLEEREEKSSEITLHFAFDPCRDLQSLPLRYLVHYGEAAKITNQTCGKGSAWNVMKINATIGMKAVPLHLDNSKKWGICLEVITYRTYQAGPILTNIVFVEAIGNDRHTPIIFVAFLACVCSLLLFGAIGLCFWKLQKSWALPIDVPKIVERNKLLSFQLGVSPSMESNSSARTTSYSESSSLTEKDSNLLEESFVQGTQEYSRNYGGDYEIYQNPVMHKKKQDDKATTCKSDLEYQIKDAEAIDFHAVTSPTLTNVELAQFSAFLIDTEHSQPSPSFLGYIDHSTILSSPPDNCNRQTKEQGNVETVIDAIECNDTIHQATKMESSLTTRQISEDEGFSSMKESYEALVGSVHEYCHYNNEASHPRSAHSAEMTTADESKYSQSNKNDSDHVYLLSENSWSRQGLDAMCNHSDSIYPNFMRFNRDQDAHSGLTESDTSYPEYMKTTLI